MVEEGVVLRTAVGGSGGAVEGFLRTGRAWADVGVIDGGIGYVRTFVAMDREGNGLRTSVSTTILVWLPANDETP